MKNLRTKLAVLVLSTLCVLAVAYGQITPLGDSYTNTTAPTTNYGAKTLLDVDGASQITYIQFNLASLPSGASVSQATLKLYVNAVTTAGSFNVDYVNGAWTENTIDSSNAPALGTTIASAVPITTADKNQYILINVTSAVQAWLDGREANNGVALVANGSFNATFDSKESTTTSHSAELDIAFAGGGTITGINTSAGSGLTGGGTSGTLNLSLNTSCGSGQVLQWDGAAWLCTGVGTGTITGVTAGTDLTGGGTSGNVTLNLNTTALNSVYPQLAASNTFNASQTINGNLSATGAVTGSSYQIGSNLFAFGSFSLGNAFLGFGGDTTTTGSGNTAVGSEALITNTSGADNTAIGASSLQVNNTGHSNSAVGVLSLTANNAGVYNAAFGNRSLEGNTSGNYNAGLGAYGLFQNTTGQYNVGVGVFAGQTVDSSAGTGNNDTALGSGAGFSTGSITNATALGSNAVVGESNALVLGCEAGVSSCNGAVNVGIGTSTPISTLDVDATVKSGLGPTVTLSNNQSGGSASSVSLDFNTYQPVAGTYNPASRIEAVDAGNYSDTIVFRANKPGAANNQLQNTMTIDPFGNVNIVGNLSKGGGSFKIDHPLDPASKYLYHSFVESPDMMDIYNGNIVTDQRGVATVVLPDYFEALNRDFRYQLTTIGQFSQVIIARKIGHNRFVIRTSKPKVEVSWQVTGVRHDAYANAHRIQVEEEKPAQEQGHYLHPESLGAPAEQAVGYPVPSATTGADSNCASSLQARQ
jgi:hypothetical protein